MKKQLIIIGIILMLLAVGLCGCTEQLNVTGDTDKVKITDYEVTTNWYEWGNDDYDSGFYNKSGFYHNYPPDSQAPIVYYSVGGDVMNIAGDFLDAIIITVKFCDADNKVLVKETETLYNLPDSHTDFFYITLAKSDTKYFDEIENVKLEVSIV